MKVLVINCGSSSLKYQVLDMTNEELICKGLVERIGMEGSVISHTKTGMDKFVLEAPMKDHKDAIGHVIDALKDEEHGVGVDSGDACLHKVHEIACQHERTRGRYGLAAEEPFGEDVDHRQHQHTEESTREAPAERRHAEERNADRDDDLAERGMRYLVRINAVEVLPCGARMVYLVKVRGIHIGLPVGAQ